MIDSIADVKRNLGMTLVAVFLPGAVLLLYSVRVAGLFRGAHRKETFSCIVFIPLFPVGILRGHITTTPSPVADVEEGGLACTLGWK